MADSPDPLAIGYPSPDILDAKVSTDMQNLVISSAASSSGELLVCDPSFITVRGGQALSSEAHNVAPGQYRVRWRLDLGRQASGEGVVKIVSGQLVAVDPRLCFDGFNPVEIRARLSNEWGAFGPDDCCSIRGLRSEST